MRHMALFFVVCVAVAAPIGTHASEGRPAINPDVLNPGFLAAHPDLYGQIMGFRAFQKGDYVKAMRLFERAAYHGDKASQAMIADMYWGGLGVERDRALGYAWMDLAAERLYPQFVAFRERYWQTMDEETRRDAIERGQAIYARYRDSVAKPRLNRILRRGRGKQVGTRTGSRTTGAWLELRAPALNGAQIVHVTEYYAEKYWEPEKYWELHDQHWRTPRSGRALVGEPEQVRTPDP